MWRRAGYAGLAACAVVAAARCGGGDDLVTLDRIGRADAPKTLKLQINAGHSTQAATQKHADGFRDLFVEQGALKPLDRYFTWMLKGFFDRIPSELDDAALIDGASRWTAFVRVVLPIALPGLTAVFVITALLAWAEFVIPFILLSDPSHLPISVGILNFQGTFAINATGILAAGSVLAILPAILLFVILQRYIVGVFVAGALKG